MHNEFHFKLIHPQLPSFYRQSRAMHFMACILLLMYARPYLFHFPDEWMLTLGIVLPSISILFVALLKKTMLQEPNTNRIFRILEIGFLCMGSMHYLQEKSYLPCILFAFVAMLLGFLLWMETRMLNDLFIVFTPQHIEIEKLLQTKIIAWQALRTIQYQSNYLTLEFKDDTFEQLAIKPFDSPEHKEVFIAFCARYLTSKNEIENTI